MSSQDVLVLAEVIQDQLADITLELLGAARPLAAATGGQVVVVVLHKDGARFADALAAADRIVVIDDAALDAFSPEAYPAVLEAIVRAESPRVVLVGSTSAGLDVAPALAARLDAPVVGGCRAIAAEGDKLVVTSSFCGGKMLSEVEVAGAPAIVTVLPGCFQPTADKGQAQVENRPNPVTAEAGKVRFAQMILPEGTDVDITQESVLVGVGRGIQQQDNMELAEELAQALGGAVCASRPIVDQGWLPTTRQVGKSGMIVKPKLYLALGISGAPEHQEGMQSAELIIAVNTDPKAPIFDFAHYGVEMDLLDLVEPLAEAIASREG